MCNNLKGPHIFSAPTGWKPAVSSSKIPDAIIRETKAVDAGTFIERNVRLSFTCDGNALQKKYKLQNWGQIFVVLDDCLYLKYTCSCTVHLQNVASSLPSYE
jgi:hypothetical protein